jgi:hypothetical protein
MAYNRFTLEKVANDFGLKITNIADSIFDEPVEPISPTNLLREFINQYLPLATAIGTEKALSEFIIAPVLAELIQISHKKISLFSGIEFTIDIPKGLNGRCDFLISLSDNQFFLTQPILTVVEAKKGDISTGFGQCIAEMVAARMFNEKNGHPLKTIYGVVSTGSSWKFMKIEDNCVLIESGIIAISDLDKLLGYLYKAIELVEK